MWLKTMLQWTLANPDPDSPSHILKLHKQINFKGRGGRMRARNTELQVLLEPGFALFEVAVKVEDKDIYVKK